MRRSDWAQALDDLTNFPSETASAAILLEACAGTSGSNEGHRILDWHRRLRCHLCCLTALRDTRMTLGSE